MKIGIRMRNTHALNIWMKKQFAAIGCCPCRMINIFFGICLEWKRKGHVKFCLHIPKICGFCTKQIKGGKESLWF